MFGKTKEKIVAPVRNAGNMAILALILAAVAILIGLANLRGAH